MKKSISMTLVLMVAVLGSAYADQQPAKAGNAGYIQQRLQNQEKRIQAGIKNGSLTSGEAYRLQSNNATINQLRIETAAADKNGKLTGKERRQFNKALDVQSRTIYTYKHNKYKLVKQ